MEIFEIAVVVLLFLILVSVAGSKGVLRGTGDHISKQLAIMIKKEPDKEPDDSEARKSLDVLKDIHELLEKQDSERFVNSKTYDIDDIYRKLDDIEMMLKLTDSTLNSIENKL